MVDFQEDIKPTNTQSSVTMDPNQDQQLLMAVTGILSFFMILGTVGNSLVLYVYIRKRNKLASTVFIITLACTDLITCVIIIPYTVVFEFLNSHVKYDFFCKLYMFLITSNVPFSAFIMVAIAVDRYLCICHPFTHLLNVKRAKMVIVGLVMVAFSLGLITALNYGVYRLGQMSYNSTNYVSRSCVNNINCTEVNKYDLDLNERKEYDLTLCNHDNSVSSIGDPCYVKRGLNASAKNTDLANVGGSLLLLVNSVLVTDGSCGPNGLIFDPKFIVTYQKIYSSFFVVVLVTVIVLYIMIYRFVSIRRARRQRQRTQSQKSNYSSIREAPTPHRHVRASISDGSVRTSVEPEALIISEKTSKCEITRQMTIREKGLVANIRTAGMLFVVTAVFIIVFLPAWLMAHEVVPYNMLIFYMYFFYNVANPLIYAFMNKSFRRNLKDALDCSHSYS